MKKLKKAVCILLCMTLTAACGVYCASAAGRDYYYDAVAGNDENDGTESSPWKSVDGHNCTITAGTRFLFKRGGTYDVCATLSASGTADAPIVIGAWGEGDKPVLTCAGRESVLTLLDCDYITVRDVEITAHDGGGIWIDTREKASTGFVIDNVTFRDMQNDRVMTSRDDFSSGAAGARAAVMVKGLPARSLWPVSDLRITNCEVCDAGNGMIVWGANKEPNYEVAIDPVFDTGVRIENCAFHDMDAEAIVLGMCDGAFVTNCSAIRTCLGRGVDEDGNILYYTAPMWFWGSVNSTFDHCEIAYSENVGDGMAVDFDTYSHRCTYQYIYSHDNMRFMCNNPRLDGHYDNTVRYCLSVNDNRGKARLASPSTQNEYGFRFYNNTIVNCADLFVIGMRNGLFANNIIVNTDGTRVKFDTFSRLSRGNTIRANAYYGSVLPIGDPFGRYVDPLFAGTDAADAQSFVLCDRSPLLGKGIAIEDDLREDFFGNPLTDTPNIGCYAGAGVPSDVRPRHTALRNLLTFIVGFLRAEWQRLFR